MGNHSAEATRCSFWDFSECTGTPFCPPRRPRFVDKNGVPIIIRGFEAGDFEPLVDMYNDLDLSSQAMGIPPNDYDRLRNWLQSLIADGWQKIAFDGDQIIGHVGVGPATDTEAEFILFVLDEYQNRGIGTELLKHAIAIAARSSYNALTINVMKENERAITVYKNIGFEITDDEAMNLATRLPLDNPIAAQAQLPPAER